MTWTIANTNRTQKCIGWIIYFSSDAKPDSTFYGEPYKKIRTRKFEFHACMDFRGFIIHTFAQPYMYRNAVSEVSG